MAAYTQPFKNIGKADGAEVGGKNASLGEMYNQLAKKGIRIPDGFATIADAYWHFIDENQLRDRLKDLLACGGCSGTIRPASKSRMGSCFLTYPCYQNCGNHTCGHTS